MERKRFKNQHHREQVHLEAVASLGYIRVFAFEIVRYLNEEGYSVTSGELGQYLPLLGKLRKENIGGRFSYSLKGVMVREQK